MPDTNQGYKTMKREPRLEDKLIKNVRRWKYFPIEKGATISKGFFVDKNLIDFGSRPYIMDKSYCSIRWNEIEDISYDSEESLFICLKLKDGGEEVFSVSEKSYNLIVAYWIDSITGNFDWSKVMLNINEKEKFYIQYKELIIILIGLAGPLVLLLVLPLVLYLLSLLYRLFFDV